MVEPAFQETERESHLPYLLQVNNATCGRSQLDLEQNMAPGSEKGMVLIGWMDGRMGRRMDGMAPLDSQCTLLC